MVFNGASSNCIIKLAPMESTKVRDEEARVRFLKKAVMGTEWGPRAITRVTDRKYALEVLSAIKASHRDLELHRAANRKNENKAHAPGYIKYLRKRKGQGEDVKDTLYSVNGRYGI